MQFYLQDITVKSVNHRKEESLQKALGALHYGNQIIEVLIRLLKYKTSVSESNLIRSFFYYI